MRGRAAVLSTLVLVVVIGALMAGVLVAATSVAARSRDVESSVRALSAYQVVQRAIAGEAFAEAAYRRAPSEQTRSRVESAIVGLNFSVSAVRDLRSPRDSGAADYLLILNLRYESIVRASLWQHGMTGATTPGYQVGPALDAMQEVVDGAVLGRQQIAQRAAAAEKDLERSLWLLAPAALVVAMVAIGLSWAVILSQHHQLRDRAEAGEHKALHDVLTGAGNRALLSLKLQVDLEESKPDVALLMVDLDRFKDINDQYGHSAGDEVLRVVAARWREASGPRDVVCRMGGDEFAVLVHPASAAEAVTANIESALQAPILHAGEELRTQASAGQAVARPEMDERAILTAADEALYARKHAMQLRSGGDVADRKSYEARLLDLSGHDPLTGLANQRRFRDGLESYLALATRSKVGGAMMLLDLDNFKDINDTFGTTTGDALLRAFADAFRCRFRESDLVARVGGDEFAVLLRTVDVADSTALSKHIVEAVKDVAVDHEGQPARTTASAGLVMLDRVGDATTDEVIAKADLAMHQAKDRGRDQLVVYGPGEGTTERSPARFHFADQIRRALDQDLFMVVAQPILDLASGQIAGCELLLRMRQDGHFVEPDEFMGAAERHDLAAAIDTRVVRLGTDLAARHRQPPGFRWEISMSAASLGDPDLPAVIKTELATKGLAPESFVFAITETAAIADLTKALAFAARVSDLGCRLALDDFGAGFGSFYYLKHLPCDYVKIDGEFIRDLRTNQTNRVIVQALASAACAMGKQTIAEYVADKPTLDLLRQYGVDHAQGLYIGRPTSPTPDFPMNLGPSDDGA